jgi:hypothetical protein
MGYEICYFYHDRLPDGKWNTEERHEMKKKVGGPTDEVELEKLAAIILTQLAKRDKLVVDVEVYEYARKKITFKESTDGSGIVLKNKKFSAGTIAGQLTVEDTEEPQPARYPHENGNKHLQLHRSEDVQRANSGSIKAWMVFDPEVHLLHDARQKGFKLTVSKKYPVYEMEDMPPGVGGSILTIVDDNNRKLRVPDKYFVANTRVRLVGDDEVEGGFSTTPKKGDPRLSYDNQYDNVDDGIGMPDLRPNLSRGMR